MTRARVTYTMDFHSADMNDQNGRIIVKPLDSPGCIYANWLCEGGKGRGANLDENTASIWEDDEAELIINSADLCQGIGTYEADIEKDEYGWYTVKNVVWV